MKAYLGKMFVLHPDVSQECLIMVESEIFRNTWLGIAPK